MNIFLLDKDPKKAVQYAVDKHVVKMPLETAQLLCSAHYQSNTETPYKITHLNHPCSKWVRESLSNYFWLIDYGLELCQEYTYRYEKVHKSQLVIEWALLNSPKIPDKELTRFPQAMPNNYKSDDVVKAYRDYYRVEKAHIFSWKKREKPFWLD
jgi:hypothetical protein